MLNPRGSRGYFGCRVYGTKQEVLVMVCVSPFPSINPFMDWLSAGMYVMVLV